MKRLGIFIALFIVLPWAYSQQYIDAVILNNSRDTIFGKVLNITDSSYTIDRFNFVFSIPKSMISGHISNYREATRYERIHMKQLDALSDDELSTKTSGYYLRKASKNFYLGLSLTTIGAFTDGFALANKYPERTETQKWIMFSCGSVITAGGLFFLLRSFYFIDKAGKIMDLERSSIYLTPTEDGGMGVKINF
ncbi:MAG: hypothetical protein J5701_03290 [Bacteroidales bacterium]|nr:hypothetical protein [Bacteroidales bacterium]